LTHIACGWRIAAHASIRALLSKLFYQFFDAHAMPSQRDVQRDAFSRAHPTCGAFSIARVHAMSGRRTLQRPALRASGSKRRCVIALFGDEPRMPRQYVKICSLYGAGFYYIPGTDTCIKIGGYLRAEIDVNANGSFTPSFANRDSRSYSNNNWRTRATITLDTRSQTDYGTLRSYMFIAATDDNSQGASYAANGLGDPSNGVGSTPYNRLYNQWAFIQFAGFTAGKTASFFDFDTQSYSNQTNFWGSTLVGSGVEVFAYTAQLGNGLSASIAAENNNGHRLGVSNAAGAADAVGGQSAPDIVGNLRIDQAWGSAQVAAAAHQVNLGLPTEPSDKWGYAIGAGLKVNLPMIGKGDYVIAGFQYGEGAIDYITSNAAQAQTTVQDGTTSFGPAWDAVVTSNTNVDLTKAWSVTGGFEHYWSSQWRSSIYGAYGQFRYSTGASAILQGATAGTTAGSSANWAYWQVGSRTVWTPVQNLDLSLEAMYNNQESAFTGPAIGDNHWWSGIFRVQRNFYP